MEFRIREVDVMLDDPPALHGFMVDVAVADVHVMEQCRSQHRQCVSRGIIIFLEFQAPHRDLIDGHEHDAGAVNRRVVSALVFFRRNIFTVEMLQILRNGVRVLFPWKIGRASCRERVSSPV